MRVNKKNPRKSAFSRSESVSSACNLYTPTKTQKGIQKLHPSFSIKTNRRKIYFIQRGSPTLLSNKVPFLIVKSPAAALTN